MSDTEERKRRPANDNPWYCLATLYGEWNEEDEDDRAAAIHAKNRHAWNRWYACVLTDEKRTHLIEKGFPPEDLEPLTDTEKSDLSIAFATRSGHANPLPPDPTEGIDFSNTHYDSPVNLSHFLFANGAFFIYAKFSNWTSFTSATFSGPAYFFFAAFSSGADFTSATFSSQACFTSAAFSSGADFTSATFSDLADFTSATFSSNSIFLNTEFKSRTVFADSNFKVNVPDFRGAKLHEATEWHGIHWPAAPMEKEQAQAQVYAYERLKQEMERLKKHEDEQFFFRKELRARRGTVPFFSWDRLLNFTYDGLSEYGQSTRRPFLWLLGLFAFGTLLLAETPTTPAATTVIGLQRAASLNYAYIFSIFPFHSAIAVGQKFSDLSALGQTIFLIETLFGTLLLFLIGLALRNKFRMR